MTVSKLSLTISHHGRSVHTSPHRYFILTGNALSYYKSEDEFFRRGTDALKGYLPIRQNTTVRSGSSSLHISITGTDDSTGKPIEMSLKAGDEVRQRQWVEAIGSCIMTARQRSS